LSKIGILVVDFSSILCAPFVPIFLRQKITKPKVTREKLLNLLLYKKRESKMLMKLTHRCRLYKRFCVSYTSMTSNFLSNYTSRYTRRNRLRIYNTLPRIRMNNIYIYKKYRLFEIWSQSYKNFFYKYKNIIFVGSVLLQVKIIYYVIDINWCNSQSMNLRLIKFFLGRISCIVLVHGRKKLSC